jgi:hypothetical protein
MAFSGAKRLINGNVVRHPIGAIIREDRKIGFALFSDSAVQHVFAGLQHVKERTCAPARDVFRRGVRGRARATVFLHDRSRRRVAPANQAPLVHRMKRVDENLRAADRQTRGNRAIAEAAHKRIFALTARAGFGQPRRQCVDVALVHSGIVADKRLAHTDDGPHYTGASNCANLEGTAPLRSQLEND